MARKSRIVLFLIIAFVLFSLLIEPALALFAFMGVMVGMGIRFGIVRVWTRKKSEKPERERRTPLKAVLAMMVLLLGIVLVTRFLQLPNANFVGRMNYQYTGTIEYHRDSKTWSVRDQVTFPKEEEINQILKASRGSKEHSASSVADMMANDGWQRELVVGTTANYTRTRVRPAKDRVYPIHTTNAIELPVFRTGTLTSSLLSNASNVRVIAPKYAVSKTYPPFKSRDDLLRDDSEVLSVPVLTLEEVPTVRVQLLSPLLQNEWGFAISKMSIWDPLKWIVLLIGGVGSDEIKKALTPGVDRVLSLIGVRVPAQADAQVPSIPPATQTTQPPVSPGVQGPASDAPHEEEKQPPSSPDGHESDTNLNE